MAPEAPPIFTQLLPQRLQTGADELLEGLDLVARAPAGRPYVVANFAATADGRATVGGRSGPIGDEGDRAFFHALREHVDCVLAGTTTLAAEGYGRILGNSRRRERRIARGLRPEPLALVITRSGEVPLTIPLFAEPEAHVVVFSGRELDASRCAAQVTVHVEPPELLAPAFVLAQLRGEYGVRSLLCEGGPTLFSAMLAAAVVDELFLTIAPKLTGGGAGRRITEGPPLQELAALELRWLFEHEGSLFARYGIVADGQASGPGEAV